MAASAGPGAGRACGGRRRRCRDRLSGPAGSELTAARRAAHRFAATGEAQLRLLPSAVGGRAKRVLVLARPDVDLDDVAGLRRAPSARARRVDKPQGRSTRDTARRAESLVTQVSQAGRAGRLLPLAQLEPGHAQLLAEDLTEAVADLAVLAAGLTRRSRERSVTVRDPQVPPGGSRSSSEKPE